MKGAFHVPGSAASPSAAPPPPPPAGERRPAGGAAAFSVGDAVSYGWTAYWKNVGPMLLITIVIIAVQLVVNIIGSVTGTSSSA